MNIPRYVRMEHAVDSLGIRFRVERSDAEALGWRVGAFIGPWLCGGLYKYQGRFYASAHAGEVLPGSGAFELQHWFAGEFIDDIIDQMAHENALADAANERNSWPPKDEQ